MELKAASQFTLEELTEAYNQTRVDYIVPMPMNVARLQEYVTVYDVDLEASCVALEEGQVLGLGMVGLRQHLGWITRLGVLPSDRRRGTGKALMEGMLTSAAARGATEMWLEVIKGNEPAHRLFHRFHFKETRELIVGRRPPAIQNEEARGLGLINPVWESISRDEALQLLAGRSARPNWLIDTPSFHHVPELAGWRMSSALGAGWVIYQPGTLQLRRIIVEVHRGEKAVVASALLHNLHQRFPMRDATIENIPPDAVWDGYRAVGYFDTFRRIEMFRPLDGPGLAGQI